MRRTKSRSPVQENYKEKRKGATRRNPNNNKNNNNGNDNSRNNNDASGKDINEDINVGNVGTEKNLGKTF